MNRKNHIHDSISNKFYGYTEDFYKWTKDQVNFLKKQEFTKMDIDNLIEEIESLGRSEKRALKSYLAILFQHLLKIKYQPAKHTKSWDMSVKNSLHQAQSLLIENPSLKAELQNLAEDAYFTGRLNAISETGLEEEVFPEKCPWKLIFREKKLSFR
jgi:hypothetical protein